MALLNPVDQVIVAAPRSTVRLNWRLLLALLGTVTFWAIALEGAAKLLQG